MSVTLNLSSVTYTAPIVTEGGTLQRDTLARARPAPQGCHAVTRDTSCVTPGLSVTVTDALKASVTITQNWVVRLASQSEGTGS